MPCFSLDFYGNSTSIAPGIDTIDNYFADSWLGNGFLRSPPSAPRIESRRVQNHSWIGTSTGPTTVDKLQRLDFAIDRDGFTSVVGLDNGAATSIPPLLGHAYHAISVGRSDGNHSTGGTSLDGSGRTKPDLVAPISATSYSSPVVAGAAALLLELADGLGFSEAAAPHAVKALLMAGATKEEFAGWDRTPARPIDNRFGAGELNIWRSCRILTAGSFLPDVLQYAGPAGWSPLDFTGPGQTRRFHFQVPAGYFLHRFGALLTWHQVMTAPRSPTCWNMPIQRPPPCPTGSTVSLPHPDPSAELAKSSDVLKQANVMRIGSLGDFRYRAFCRHRA